MLDLSEDFAFHLRNIFAKAGITSRASSPSSAWPDDRANLPARKVVRPAGFRATP